MKIIHLFALLLATVVPTLAAAQVGPWNLQPNCMLQCSDAYRLVPDGVEYINGQPKPLYRLVSFFPVCRWVCLPPALGQWDAGNSSPSGPGPWTPWTPNQPR